MPANPLCHLFCWIARWSRLAAHDVDPGVFREVGYRGVNRTSCQIGKAAVREAEFKVEGYRTFAS